MYSHHYSTGGLGDPTAAGCTTTKSCPTVLDPAAPFDRVAGVRTTKHSGAPWQVKHVEQRLQDALTRFVRDAQQFIFLPAGLVLVTLRSMGAYNCRCISGTDDLSGHALGRAFDLSGWTFWDPAGPVERVVIYERLVRARQWQALHRIGACLHLNFGQVLDWTYNADHENHFHAELTDSPSIRWGFVDRLLSFTLGESLRAMGWVAPRGRRVTFTPPRADVAAARVRALQAFAGRAPVPTYTLFRQRFARPWAPTPGETAKLLMVHVARNGFRL